MVASVLQQVTALQPQLRPLQRPRHLGGAGRGTNELEAAEGGGSEDCGFGRSFFGCFLLLLLLLLLLFFFLGGFGVLFGVVFWVSVA